MSIFSIYRHHLANAAHRRYLANNPSAAQLRRAEARANRPVSGARCSEKEWLQYVTTWRPALEGHRAMMISMYSREASDGRARNDADRVARAESALDRLREPITWAQISAYAHQHGATAKRPPRSLERTLTPTA